jgi:UDP-2,3-diacylglucosamine hydrolase
MAIYFISDLHLDPSRPALGNIFQRFVSGPAKRADALYILGDLFNYWIGDDGSMPEHQPALDALALLTRSGVPVYFMHGNRDFLVGQAFCERTGVKLIQDPALVSLYGTLTLLTHGDSLCTDDVNHQRARQKWLDPRRQARILALPIWIRRLYAAWLRRRSRMNKAMLPASIMDVSQSAVEDSLRKHGVWQMIHGHTHRPATHDFNLDGAPARRIVLSDWHDDHGSLLSYSAEGVAREDLS